jgi:hypothetical protein
MTEYAQARREPGQVVTIVVAALFLLAGILDVGPGLLDNLVHLGFGVAGLSASRGPRGAHAFLIGGGVAYFLFWQFGAVINPSLVPFHNADVAVHLALVASMIGLAVLSGGRRAIEPMAELLEVDHLPQATQTAYFGRPRPTSSRPPGRDDRLRTPPRMAAAGRPPAGLACRA